MADVTITYKGANIATMDATGSKTLQTAGTYCEGDIGVEYVKPGGGGGVVAQALSVSNNGMYYAPAGMAYDPVTVAVYGKSLPAPTDGNIHLHIYIPDDTPSELLKMAIYINNSGNASGIINFGEGYSESLKFGEYTYGHTYSGPGLYDATITVNSGTIAIEGSSGGSGMSLYGNRASANHYRRGRIRRIYLNSKVTSIGGYGLYNCYNLEYIDLAGVTSIGTNAFSTVYAMGKLTIPATVTSIGAGAFNNCYNLVEYHFKSTTPPTLDNTSAFTGIRSDCVIYVPSASLSAYKTATNWSTYANYMQGE